MGEDFTAYPGNRRYTPEEWLEALDNHGGQSGNIDGWEALPPDPAAIIEINEPVQGDGRTRVYGNPVDLANARKYMRPDRYVFIESTASGELPGEGDIVLGSAPARAGAMRIAGKTAAETEKAIWDTMVSLGANWVDNDAGLSTLYITGDIPELHREPGMGEDFTAYPGNRRYTPEEWLEKFKLLSEGAEESE